MFWTTAVPGDSVDIHLGEGKASLHFSNVAVFDAFTVKNSLCGGPRVPATIVTVDIEWSGVKRRVEACDASKQFAGTYVENSATIAVTAYTPSQSFLFVSDPASTITNFAQIGHEQNGVFFPGCG